MINRKTKKKTVTKVKKPNMAGTSSVMSKTKNKINKPSSPLRRNLKDKQKIANEIGTKGTRPNQAFLGGSASQIPKSKTKKTKRLVDIQKRSPSRKTNKKLGPYRSGNVLQNIVDSNKKAFPLKKKAGGKTTKYMARGGKTSKYMAKGGRAK